MRFFLSLSAALGLALALAGCATSRAPHAITPSSSPASTAATAATPTMAVNGNGVTGLGGAKQSPRQKAQALYEEARKQQDSALALKAAVYALRAGDEKLADKVADLMHKIKPQSVLPDYIRLRTGLDTCAVGKALKAAKNLYDQGINEPLEKLVSGNYDNWCVYALVGKLSAAHPDDDQLTQLLAQTALMAGDNGTALKAARKAVADGLDDLLLRLIEVQAQWELGERHAALKQGADLLSKHSRDVGVRAMYAQLLTRAGDYHRAKEVLSDGAALTPGNIHLEIAYVLLDQARGDNKAARKRLTKLLENGNTQDRVYYLLGEDAASSGNWQQAFVWYASADGDTSAQVAAADALRHWKGLDTARGFLSKLKQHEPGLDPLWQGTEAGLLDSEGQSRAAYTLLSKAVKRYPVVRPLQYQKALLADSLGKTRVSLGILSRLVKSEPRNSLYLNAYGYTLTEHTNHYDKAYHYIREALNADPDEPAILDSMGWVLYKQGKPGEALKYLKRANKKGNSGQNDATLSAHLVQVYMALGQKGAARRLLKEALAKSPKDAQLQRLSKRLQHKQ